MSPKTIAKHALIALAAVAVATRVDAVRKVVFNQSV